MAKDGAKIHTPNLIKPNPEFPTLMHNRIQKGWTNTTKLTNIREIQTQASESGHQMR
jgi:hypothetical protein